jgi:hypothetical protein
MEINRNKPDLWKEDIASSVDFYNKWFLFFAPKTFVETRKNTAGKVTDVFEKTSNLRDISSNVLAKYPEILPVLRMCSCPPIAQDRLSGLSGVQKSLIGEMEGKDGKKPRIPPKMSAEVVRQQLDDVSNILNKLIDRDLFSWLNGGNEPTSEEKIRSAMVVADRLCGSLADPLIRNAQEQRQLKAIGDFLVKNGYSEAARGVKYDSMPPATFLFRSNVQVAISSSSTRKVNIPVDVLIKRKNSSANELPLMIEAKSAGDFTNVNKRRKEEATKMQQLKMAFGDKAIFVLFLCGYFDSGYLGYEAAEGIDWVWEHRISDLTKAGI